MKTKILNERKSDEKPVGLFRCGNYIVVKIKRTYKPDRFLTFAFPITGN
jgi:hypothetical protein